MPLTIKGSRMIKALHTQAPPPSTLYLHPISGHLTCAFRTRSDLQLRRGLSRTFGASLPHTQHLVHGFGLWICLFFVSLCSGCSNNTPCLGGGSNNRDGCLPALETGSPRSRGRHGLFLVKSAWLWPQMAFSSVWALGKRALFLSFLIKVLIPS